MLATASIVPFAVDEFCAAIGRGISAERFRAFNEVLADAMARAGMFSISEDPRCMVRTPTGSRKWTTSSLTRKSKIEPNRRPMAVAARDLFTNIYHIERITRKTLRSE
jgi:hypothetical protein